MKSYLLEEDAQSKTRVTDDLTPFPKRLFSKLNDGL